MGSAYVYVPLLQRLSRGYKGCNLSNLFKSLEKIKIWNYSSMYN
jgi:hypothetical protein